MVYDDNIILRYAMLRLKAASRYNITPDSCHIGHLILQGMLENPKSLHQIDGTTETSETNASIAVRTSKLADAMNKCGLVPGDAVIISAPNHLDLAVPFYATHYNGYSMCSIDPAAEPVELRALFPYILPKMVFCQKEHVTKIQETLEYCNMSIPIVVFDDPSNDVNTLIQKYKGTEVEFKPAVGFDTANTPAWLMLTSGTTGTPKVAVMTYDHLYQGIIEWWDTVPIKLSMTMIMATTQWLSTLVFFISAPLKPFIRLQSSKPLTAPSIIKFINKYRPDATGWTPFLLAQFVLSDKSLCDLTCFKSILIGGSAMEKHILDQFKKVCPANLRLAYGMTELFVPVFDFGEDKTPFGSTGKPYPKYHYKFVDDENKEVDGIETPGELWIKGGPFFKCYLNNPEETRKILTEDGWIKTGDIFRRDENNFFYFVERKKLLVRYLGSFLSPLQFEEAIKKHPGVAEACMVGVPDPAVMELPVAAIKKKNGNNVDPQEIFKLLKDTLQSEKSQLWGGLFFVENFPMTASGKINRNKVLEMAKTAQRILPK